jgi:hypothetical protein
MTNPQQYAHDLDPHFNVEEKSLKKCFNFLLIIMKIKSITGPTSKLNIDHSWTVGDSNNTMFDMTKVPAKR